MAISSATAWQDARTIHVFLHGVHWRLERGPELEKLWTELDPGFDLDDRIPYWTELWPSSLLLAAFLQDRAEEIKGMRCLDLSCGLGLTAMLGQARGGKVVGMDYMPEAMRIASRQALPNLAPQPAWICADWRQSPFRPRSFSRVWGADIAYEKRFIRPLLNFMANVLSSGGRAWIAEPGRAIFRQFIETAEKEGWQAQKRAAAPVSPLYPQTARAVATIWEVIPPDQE